MFIFVRMSGQLSDIDIRLAIPASVAEADASAARRSILDSLSAFDARRARCLLNGDRHRLLALIETSFGTTAPFSKLVRGIFDEKLKHEHNMAEA